jgi:hypothetical protein
MEVILAALAKESTLLRRYSSIFAKESSMRDHEDELIS